MIFVTTFFSPVGIVLRCIILSEDIVFGTIFCTRIQMRKSRFFFTISCLHREPSPVRTLKWPGRNRVQITCNTRRVYHVHQVVLFAKQYEATAELLSLAGFKSHLFVLYFIG